MSLSDSERLAALARLKLTDSRAEPRLDRLTRLTSRALRVPVALISIVDDSRQFFKSEIGLPEPWASERQTSLTHSFCQHVVVTSAPLRVEDARRHPLVRDNHAVSDLNVIAYLGMPLRAPGGHVVGSLCAIDAVPRAWTPDDEDVLRDLADIVEDQIGLSISERRWREILNAMPQMVWSTLPDGHVDFYNERWYSYTGTTYGSTDGAAWSALLHPDDQSRTWNRWLHSLRTGEPYEIEYRLRHATGEYRWALGLALPLRDDTGKIDRWFGTCTDIHALKLAEAARDLVSRELSHRIQNIFALVSGLITLASRRQPEAKVFAEAVVGRIQALSRAHRYVGDHVEGRDIDGTISGLLETVLSPYGDRVSVIAENCPVTPTEASSIALIVHEFATNAVKYGALSSPEGIVDVRACCTNGLLTLDWSELGGPRLAQEPVDSGFGSRLMDTLIKSLGASIIKDWRHDGLVAKVVVPLRG